MPGMVRYWIFEPLNAGYNQAVSTSCQTHRDLRSAYGEAVETLSVPPCWFWGTQPDFQMSQRCRRPRRGRWCWNTREKWRVLAQGTAEGSSQPASVRCVSQGGVDCGALALTAERWRVTLFDARHGAVGEAQGAELLAVLVIAVDFDQVAVVEHGDLGRRDA